MSDESMNPTLRAAEAPEPVYIPPVGRSDVPLINSDDLDDEEDMDTIEATRAEIEMTRAQMTGTIDEIKDRLSPATLVAEAKEAVKDAASDTAHNIVDKAKDMAASASDAIHNAADYVSEKATPMVEAAKEKLAPAVEVAKNVGTTAKGAGGTVVDTIRMNPVPSALIGFGLGWLLLSARRQNRVEYSGYQEYDGYAGAGADNVNRNSDRDYLSENGVSEPTTGAKVREKLHDAGDAVTSFASNTKDKAADLATSARDKASELASTAKDKAGDIAHATKDKAQATVSSVDTWVHENPLAAGAIAVLIGAAVGLALPATQKENELFGPKRDELAHKAAETAHDVVDKVQNVAQTALGTAKDALGTATQQITAEVKQEAQNQGLTVA